jgi:hypothetical protein
MLAEADALSRDTNANEELIGSGHEIGKGFIVDDLGRNSFRQRQIFDNLSFYGKLVFGREKGQLHFSYAVELVVALVLGINEVLDLSHSELSDSQEPLLGMDFVTEAETDLSSGEWHAAVVEVNQSSKVDEDALSCFRPEETSLGSSGANLGLKHEIERQSFTKVVASVGSLNGEILNGGINLSLAKRTSIVSDLKETILLILLHVLLLGHNLLNVLLNKLVSTVALARLQILDHEVSKLLHMTLYAISI